MYNSKAIRCLIVGILLLLGALHSGCTSSSPGPFAYPDGIYEGASDLYD